MEGARLTTVIFAGPILKKPYFGITAGVRFQHFCLIDLITITAPEMISAVNLGITRK